MEFNNYLIIDTEPYKNLTLRSVILKVQKVHADLIKR